VKNIVAIHSITPIGGTFLDWSIHYVSGQKNHFNYINNKWTLLVDNPLDASSAHGHAKNHPSGIQDVKLCLDTFQEDKLYSFYPYFQEYNFWSNYLGFALDNLNDNNWKTIEQHQQQELDTIAQVCQRAATKNIEIQLNKRWAPYLLMNRVEPAWLQKITRYKGLSDYTINRSYQQDYNQWDLREKLALDIRPFKTPGIKIALDKTLPYYSVSCEDLWFAGTHLIPNLLRWLELPFDKERYHYWATIYQQWQEIQFRSLKFIWQLNDIVDAVINNHYFQLQDLSLMQEAIILHCLIYQHNLNLKAYNLTKFPSNTQLLHQLLEPNHHQLDVTYQDVLRTSVDSLRSSTLF
jgi:hypothetical protein